MAEDSGQERKLPASAKKLQKAREEGQVAKSKEVSSVLLVGGAIALFVFLGDFIVGSLVEVQGAGLDMMRFYERDSGFAGLYERWTLEALKIAAPFFFFFSVLAVVSNVGQVGILFTTKPLVPKLNRLNPVSGLKRIFSLNGFVELIKSVIKIGIVGGLVYVTLAGELAHITGMYDRSFGRMLTYSALLAFKLVVRIWLVMFLLAMLDLFYQRWKHAKDLRMTRQEAKDELKETEGDPRVKARIRSLQLRTARQRMMQEIPKADVVITNPDHVAVALRYDRVQDMAPVVVASGAGWLCQRIKETAREHGVPVLENPPLARFLYRNVKLGQQIPAEVYRVVAEILAHVYRIRGRLKHGTVSH